MKGTLRGRHMQVTALQVRVLSGEIFDVAVVARTGSPTFAGWFGMHLYVRFEPQRLLRGSDSIFIQPLEESRPVLAEFEAVTGCNVARKLTRRFVL